MTASGAYGRSCRRAATRRARAACRARRGAAACAAPLDLAPPWRVHTPRRAPAPTCRPAMHAASTARASATPHSASAGKIHRRLSATSPLDFFPKARRDEKTEFNLQTLNKYLTRGMRFLYAPKQCVLWNCQIPSNISLSSYVYLLLKHASRNEA